MLLVRDYIGYSLYALPKQLRISKTIFAPNKIRWHLKDFSLLYRPTYRDKTITVGSKGLSFELYIERLDLHQTSKLS